MTTTSTSRRAILAGASALPALAVPALGSSATSVSACTLPPDLIERFVRMRTWYLDYRRRVKLWDDERGKRFFATTGVTLDEYHDMDYHNRLKEGLSGASRKISDEMDAEALGFDIPESEVERLSDERWAVAEAMILECKAQTIVDLAWQLEAFLIADIEILDETGDGPHEWMHRTLLQNIRTLGAIPQPDDPLGSLSIDIGNDDELGATS